MFQPYFLLCILFLDYEFLKRVASYLGLQLICDTINPNNVFYFGTPSSKYYKLEEDIDYTASIDIKNIDSYQHQLQIFIQQTFFITL